MNSIILQMVYIPLCYYVYMYAYVSYIKLEITPAIRLKFIVNDPVSSSHSYSERKTRISGDRRNFEHFFPKSAAINFTICAEIVKYPKGLPKQNVGGFKAFGIIEVNAVIKLHPLFHSKKSN